MNHTASIPTAAAAATPVSPAPRTLSAEKLLTWCEGSMFPGQWRGMFAMVRVTAPEGTLTTPEEGAAAAVRALRSRIERGDFDLPPCDCGGACEGCGRFC